MRRRREWSLQRDFVEGLARSCCCGVAECEVGQRSDVRAAGHDLLNGCNAFVNPCRRFHRKEQPNAYVDTCIIKLCYIVASCNTSMEIILVQFVNQSSRAFRHCDIVSHCGSDGHTGSKHQSQAGLQDKVGTAEP